MILSTIDNKFVVPCTSEKELDLLRAIPTARKKPRQDVMTFTSCVWSCRHINSFIDSGILTPTEDAKELLHDTLQEYKEKRRRIKAAETRYKHGENVLPVPLKTMPREYQARAFGFSISLNSSALLMDQGTGKTMVAIAIAGYRALNQGVKRILIIPPKPVIPVWPRELQKHADYDYDLTCQYEFKVPEVGDNPHIWVVNYDKIRTNQKAIQKWKPELIILDESHKIKNRGSNRSRALHSLGKLAPYKLIMTGTPIGQSPLDIFSQYKFLDDDIFSSDYDLFQKRYAIMGGYKGYQVKGYRNLDELAEKVHSISFRVTKQECLDLPPISFQSLYCCLTPKARKIYKQLQDEFKVEIDDHEIKVDRVVAQMAKLRQITGGGVLSSEDEQKLIPISKEKVSVVKEFLEGRDITKKTIIFVCFTHEIELLSDMVEGLGVGCLTLHGGTPEEERDTLEQTFREDSFYKVAIIQIATGAEGLDFTVADVSIFYSPAFSFINYDQACARTHRIGQVNAVTYINIIVEDSIDEPLVDLLIEHSKVSKNLLDAKRNYKLQKTGIKNVTPEKEQELDTALKRIKEEIETNGLSKKRIKKRLKKKLPKKKLKGDADTTIGPRIINGYSVKDFALEFDISVVDMRKYLHELDIDKPGKAWIWSSKKSSQLRKLRPRLRALIKAVEFRQEMKVPKTVKKIKKKIEKVIKKPRKKLR